MAYARARQLMKLNLACLDNLAANALERETRTREDCRIPEAHRSNLNGRYWARTSDLRGVNAMLSQLS
jgi:hypothetical protein